MWIDVPACPLETHPEITLPIGRRLINNHAGIYKLAHDLASNWIRHADLATNMSEQRKFSLLNLAPTNQHDDTLYRQSNLIVADI
jgi:hypothetical protein